MAWTTDMVLIVRGLINDLVEPYTYSDARLQQLICVAGVLVLQELGFSTTYTIDLTAKTITPEPADDFEALVSLKTACMISQGEHRTSANQSLVIRDGPSTIDTTPKTKNLEGLAMTACEAYRKAKLNYQIGDGSVGKAIVSPYGGVSSGSNTGR